MVTNTANMLIYLKGHSSTDIRKGVERSLKRDRGVLEVGLPEGKDYMVLVGYNPEITDSLTLLHRAESSGIHAKIVGL